MKIAITGSIGSGKSTVTKYLKKKGYDVFSCDDYNAYLLNNNQNVIAKLKNKFPECFEDDILNKKSLADVVFNDKRQKMILEKILHPLIIKEMLKEAKKHSLFFAEVPLLFENDLETLFDHNLLIVCDKEIALKRLLKRGLNKQEAILRLENQMDVQNKMLRAKQIIYNNGNLKDLYQEVDKWLLKYVR